MYRRFGKRLLDIFITLPALLVLTPVLLSLALLFAGSHSPVMIAFLAAVAGQLVFVLMLELPVSIGVMAGRDPLRTLEQHFGQGGPLFLRAGIGGLATAVLVFLLY